MGKRRRQPVISMQLQGGQFSWDRTKTAAGLCTMHRESIGCGKVDGRVGAFPQATAIDLLQPPHLAELSHHALLLVRLPMHWAPPCAG